MTEASYAFTDKGPAVPVRPRPDYYGMDVRAAAGAGLRTRPVMETLRDTLAWARRRPDLAVAATTSVPAADREAELLREWCRQPAGDPGGAGAAPPSRQG